MNGTDVAVNPSVVRIGQQWVVELHSNPSTGYSWSIQPGLDDTILELVSTDFRSAIPEGEHPPIGSGGTRIFVFEAVGAGTTSILIYWEQGGPPHAEEYSQEITVIPKRRGAPRESPRPRPRTKRVSEE